MKGGEVVGGEMQIGGGCLITSFLLIFGPTLPRLFVVTSAPSRFFNFCCVPRKAPHNSVA